MKRMVITPVALILVTLLAACGSPLSDDSPRLTGGTCEELARSYGRELQQRQLAILDAAEYPEDRVDPAYDQEAHEVWEGLQETRHEVHRALAPLYGPVSFPDCPPDRFLSIAERELGERFRKEVSPANVTGGDRPDWGWYRDLLHKDIEVAWQND